MQPAEDCRKKRKPTTIQIVSTQYAETLREANPLPSEEDNIDFLKRLEAIERKAAQRRSKN